MAILDKVEITISSGGNVLQEYDVGADDETAVEDVAPSSNSATTIKYIEAIPGANFEINYAVKPHQPFGDADYLSLTTYVDGRRMLSPAVPKDKFHLRGGFSQSRSGPEIKTSSDCQTCPFYWTELLTTDEKPDTSVAQIMAKYRQIGTIRVEVRRRKGSRTNGTSPKKAIDASVVEQPIPEKALKGQALDLGTGLQEPKPSRPHRTWHGTYIDKDPLAIFVLRYRTKNALQILGVLPRSPSPVPLEERDPETLTREEMVELLRRQQAQREIEKAKVKKEEIEANLLKIAALGKRATAGGDDKEEDDDEIELIASPKKKARRSEVIDLT